MRDMSESGLQILLVEKQGNHHGRTMSVVNCKPPNYKAGVKIVQNEYSFQDNKVTSEATGLDVSKRFKHFLASVFLPDGYPDTVSGDYIPYQIWDTIQAFSSSLTGSLSTKAVLQGIGVGSTNSTALAATITWLIKDGTGMLGRIGFAWWKGSQLDADSKKWRLFADILNDAAICVDLCAPIVQVITGGSGSAVTALLCTSGTAKSIVGVAGGATRAALTQHQAVRGNLADVAAKDGSQETLVNLAALLTSLWLLPAIGNSTGLTWSLFAFFTILHLYANYRAVTSVVMPTLNRSRYLIVLKHFFATGEVPGVKRTNRQEPVILGYGLNEEDVCGWKVMLGQPITTVIHNSNSMFWNVKLEELTVLYSNKHYMLIPDEHAQTMHVLIRQNSSAKDLLEAYHNALLIASILSGKVRVPFSDSSELARRVVSNEVEGMSWTSLHAKLAAKGWNLNHSLLPYGEWRAKWNFNEANC